MFARYNRAYFQRWLLLGVAIGIGAGVSMVLFFTAIGFCTHLFLGYIAGYTPPSPVGEGGAPFILPRRAWLIPVATTLGGLLTGLVVYTLAPAAAGGGTDSSINAFHENNGRIQSRIPAVKLVASAITIGSGGSAGREGAAAQIVAGIGSWMGDLLHLDDHDRRIAVVAGIGAGIGTIFRAPFAGALFAAEVLYKRDFEADAVFPTFIASVVGYAIYGAFEGWAPVFGTHAEFRFDYPPSLISFVILGICCGVLGLLFQWSMKTSHALFHRLPFTPIVKPAIGGLLVGIIGVFLPETLAMGYGFVQFGIDGNYTQLGALLLGVLVFVKMAATSLTIGSGGSGGDVAPAMVIGGFLGGSLWAGLHFVWPAVVINVLPGAFVVVGMAAFFGGIANTPLAMILMVAEMTGQLSLIVPGMLATMVAYIITGETSIYSRQVATRLDSPAHKNDYVLPLLQNLKVSDAMSEGLSGALATAIPDTPLNDVATFFRERGVATVPVIDNGRLVGMLTARDLARMPPADISSGITRASQVMSRAISRAYPDESLYSAWLRMSRRGLRQLVVVDRANPSRLVGVLTADSIGQMLRLPTGRRAKAGMGDAPGEGAAQPTPVSASIGANAARGASSTASAMVGGASAPNATAGRPSATSATGQSGPPPGKSGTLPRQPEVRATPSRGGASPVPTGPAAERALDTLARSPSDGDPLIRLRVAGAMLAKPAVLPSSAPLPDVRAQLERAYAVLVVDASGMLVGIITRGDLGTRADVEAGKPLTAADVAVRNLVTATPTETLRAAVRRMSRLGLRQMPVVEHDLPAPPVGLLRRSDVLAAYGRALTEDYSTVSPA